MTWRPPTVGVVGAGQLARMTIQAAIPLDVRIVLLAADVDDSAALIAPRVIVGSPDDRDTLKELAQRSDVITFDHELVNPATLAWLEAAGHRVWPSSSTMALAQDKRRQRRELGDAGFPIPSYANIDCLDALLAFGEGHDWRVVVKASSGGYDGRGVWMVDSPAEAAAVWRGAQSSGTVLLAEERLPLDLEFAVLMARTPGGEIAVYPPVETVQRDGICHELRVPARIDADLGMEATRIAREIAEQIGMVGILGIEFFVSRGELYLNELAPRPHNSGHWTIDGGVTSQFEQHLRAVLDLPLGSPEQTGQAIVTLNLLGRGTANDPRLRLAAGLAAGNAHVHFYGKEARAGRKIGHVTAIDNSIEAASARVWAVRNALFDVSGL
ncbi:5-(carboxyamino)imidazole ribonucleotide synthase [soil metagenome]